MGRLNPFSLQMQITQMFEQGQSFFATIKVQDWLKERNQNPADYDILFHQKPAPPGSKAVMVVEIELRRKDGQPVEPWLQEQANLHA
ncbi:hypothetical protein SAMD00079811_53660 [Scytonema sp. HK-05]|jgi:hypothetical protein|uniref:hypothetical protein n=1 Tax=Scytonema sp. HK-05 TaxID=1137095 RepID=UPI0009360003|nr:hypothetical protein [Scytonema sp. HK-05]OKH48287.1 hypothetical protein NIES2130_35405 [Scytonema sp. HK-05]BAY47747.1 hypothetical protein SAMD00079811_53660 [Scytonema sp. HK-05]